MIPLSKPDITQTEINKVTAVLHSTSLSGGPVIKEFEKQLAGIAGTKYAVALNSGTAALHLIMLALGIGAGDEVITTPYSFISSSNCILYVGAKPVFCDICPLDLNIDPEKIESKITSRTKAILVVHVFGFPAKMEKITALAKKYHLAVIEDACEAIGSKIHGKPVGGQGFAGTFAFYPNKQITTGEGGAILTNDTALAETARCLANQGREMNDQWLVHSRLGYNYRLSELAAALGSAQLGRFDEILSKRATVANWYREELALEPLLTLPNTAITPEKEISWFVYVIRLCSPPLRPIIIRHLTSKGIQTRTYFPAIHLQPFYQKLFGFKEGDFPNTEQAANTGLALPFFTAMTRAQVTEVCDNIREILDSYRTAQARLNY